MTVQTIEEKTRFITDAKGRRREVILPYKVYRELLELKISQEIYHQPDTQAAIRRAKRDIRKGRYHDYREVEELIQDLHHAP